MVLKPLKAIHYNTICASFHHQEHSIIIILAQCLFSFCWFLTWLSSFKKVFVTFSIFKSHNVSTVLATGVNNEHFCFEIVVILSAEEVGNNYENIFS